MRLLSKNDNVHRAHDFSRAAVSWLNTVRSLCVYCARAIFDRSANRSAEYAWADCHRFRSKQLPHTLCSSCHSCGASKWLPYRTYRQVLWVVPHRMCFSSGERVAQSIDFFVRSQSPYRSLLQNGHLKWPTTFIDCPIHFLRSWAPLFNFYNYILRPPSKENNERHVHIKIRWYSSIWRVVTPSLCAFTDRLADTLISVLTQCIPCFQWCSTLLLRIYPPKTERARALSTTPSGCWYVASHYASMKFVLTYDHERAYTLGVRMCHFCRKISLFTQVRSWSLLRARIYWCHELWNKLRSLERHGIVFLQWV